MFLRWSGCFEVIWPIRAVDMGGAHQSGILTITESLIMYVAMKTLIVSSAPAKGRG
jgi:hypothetical protein